MEGNDHMGDHGHMGGHAHMRLGDDDHMRGNQDPIQDIQGPHGDKPKMDTTQDIHRLHKKNIMMRSGPITKSRVKKLEQVFQTYVRKWINE